MGYYTYIANNNIVITSRGDYDYVLSDKHRWLDEDILYDDYTVGNGGFVSNPVVGEWDWFLEMDWKHLSHGMSCKCYDCKKYWLPAKIEAKKWLLRNSPFSPKISDLGIGVISMEKMRAELKDSKKASGVKMTNEEIDEQIRILQQMKNDNDIAGA